MGRSVDRKIKQKYGSPFIKFTILNALKQAPFMGLMMELAKRTK